MKPRLTDSHRCTGCAACADICNHHAIKMRYDKNGFLRPFVDTAKCVGCKVCEHTCPIINFGKLPFHKIKDIHHFAAWSLDDEVCKKATSGGIFSQLAINLLDENDNAIVLGAELSQHNTCNHIAIEHKSDIYRISGTKYIQSNAEGSYVKVRKAIKGGQKFSIAALHARLLLYILQ